MRCGMPVLTRSGTSGRSSITIERDALSLKGAKLCGAVRKAVGDRLGAAQ